jgi:GAF domain-containing protein
VPSAVPVVIADGSTDPRVKDSPLVTGPLGLRFYVGVPLTRHDGTTVGTLSVLDTVPRSASHSDIANLQDLAALVVAQLELRRESLRITNENIRITNERLLVTPPSDAAAGRKGSGPEIETQAL